VKYVDVCSGYSAPTLAWKPLGWEPVCYAEVDPFASAVLGARYGATAPKFMLDPETAPDRKERLRRIAAINAVKKIDFGTKVRNQGDFTTLRDEPELIVDADVLVGGTPCQDFSLAGLRASLAGDRGNLTMEFIRLADAIDDLRRADGRPPAFVLWENVPGVFSTDDNAFGSFLGGLCGSLSPIVPPGGGRWTDAGVVSGPRRVAAWRVLDAQHFGLAQRRRRVFVLACGHPGAWAVADALLPIIESLRGASAPSRGAGSHLARSLTASTGGASAKESSHTFIGGDGRPLHYFRGSRGTRRPDGLDQAFKEGAAVSSSAEGGTDLPFLRSAHHLTNQTPLVALPVDTEKTICLASAQAEVGLGIATTLTTLHEAPIVAGVTRMQAIPFDTTQITHPENRSKPKPGDPAPTLARQGHPPAIAIRMSDTGANGTPLADDIAHTLDTGKNPQAVIAFNSREDPDVTGDITGPLGASLPQAQAVAILGAENLGISAKNGEDGLVAYVAPVAPVAPTLPSRHTAGGGLGTDTELDGALIAVSFSTRGRDGSNEIEPEPGDVAPALRTGGGGADKPFVATAFKPAHFTRGKDGKPSELAPSLSADADKGDQEAVLFVDTAVRRLTPRECERLQGAPDDFTLIPYSDARRDDTDLAETIAYLMEAGYGDNEAAVLARTPDGPRYRALGNSMARDVIEELGRKIEIAQALMVERGFR
jgi:DNA (cytosine-5)-methyltransferase 1